MLSFAVYMNNTLTFDVLLKKEKTFNVYNGKYCYIVERVSTRDAISLVLNIILEVLLQRSLFLKYVYLI